MRTSGDRGHFEPSLECSGKGYVGPRHLQFPAVYGRRRASGNSSSQLRVRECKSVPWFHNDLQRPPHR